MKKPKAKVTGKDGNVFNVLSICSKALRDSGQESQIKDMTSNVMNCSSYEEALKIMNEYCELI
jgi:single-stranded DNA-binding protein